MQYFLRPSGFGGMLPYGSWELAEVLGRAGFCSAVARRYCRSSLDPPDVFGLAFHVGSSEPALDEVIEALVRCCDD